MPTINSFILIPIYPKQKPHPFQNGVLLIFNSIFFISSTGRQRKESFTLLTFIIDLIKIKPLSPAPMPPYPNPAFLFLFPSSFNPAVVSIWWRSPISFTIHIFAAFFNIAGANPYKSCIRWRGPVVNGIRRPFSNKRTTRTATGQYNYNKPLSILLI